VAAIATIGHGRAGFPTVAAVLERHLQPRERFILFTESATQRCQLDGGASRFR
jgi:hypothetical protein